MELPALALQQPESPLASYAKAMQIKSMGQQQTLQTQQIQQNQMSMDSQKALAKAYMDAQGDPDKTMQNAMKYGVRPADLLTLRQSLNAQKLQTIDLVSKQGALAKQQADMMQGAHDAVSAVPPEARAQMYQQQLQGLQQAGLDVSKMPPQYPGDDAFKFLGVAVKSHSQMVEDALKQAEQQKNAAQAAEANAAIPGKVAESAQKQKVLAGTSPTGVTAEQQAQLDQGKTRIGIEKSRLGIEYGKFAEEKRHNQATEGSLTPEALSMAAKQYASTGVMPAMGRTAGLRAQIMNEAARAYPKLDPALNAAEYSANKESLKKLQSNFDQVTAFENTANKNLDLFLEQAKKVVDSGSPLVNTPLRMISKQLGGVNMPAYDTARQVAVNEIAKVTGSPGLSGQLSDTARKEVSNFNPDNATLAQTYKVAQVLRQDMANRHDSYAEEIKAIQARIGGGGEQKTDQSKTGGPMKITLPSGKQITID